MELFKFTLDEAHNTKYGFGIEQVLLRAEAVPSQEEEATDKEAGAAQKIEGRLADAL